MKTRDKMIEQAKHLINEDRAQDYGDAYQNHGRIAEGWNIIMREALTTHGHLTAAHVALMMDWVKTSRLLHDLEKLDSWVDKIGYSALGAEFAKYDAMSIEERLKEI